MKLPRSVGFVTWFVYPGSISQSDDDEARRIIGWTRENYQIYSETRTEPRKLVSLPSTIDFRSADQDAVALFLDSLYPKVRLAAQYALGWEDETAVVQRLTQMYPDKHREETELLTHLMIRGFMSDTQVLMGFSPAGRHPYTAYPRIAKFLFQIGVSMGIDQKLVDIVERAEVAYEKKKGRKVGFMNASPVDSMYKELEAAGASGVSKHYILTLMDELTMQEPDGLFVERQVKALQDVAGRDIIYNIWESGYEMLWNAGYRW